MKGFRICRICGINIEFHPSFIFLVTLFAWILILTFSQALPELPLTSLLAAVVFSVFLLILSIIFHELAHSLVVKRFKVEVSRIVLFFLGGVAQFDEKAFDKPVQELLISAVGPLSSLLLAGIFFGVKSLLAPSALAVHIFNWFFTINICLAVFNSLPCFPMDGGRILRAICFWKTKDFVKATKIAGYAASAVGILIIVGVFLWQGWFAGIWIGMIIWLVISEANREYQHVKRTKTKD